MKAKESFDNSILEIDVLNEIVSTNPSSSQAVFKSIILLLCAKLEKFVKDSAEEYIESLLSMKLKKQQLPEKLVNEVIKKEIKKISEETVERYCSKEENKRRAKNLSLIWDSDYVLDNLEKSDYSSSLSASGTNAIDDLFAKIGFPEFVGQISDLQITDGTLSISSTTSYSVRNTLNRVIWLRHNIIHDDATPFVTANDIGVYKRVFVYFVSECDKALASSLSNLSS